MEALSRISPGLAAVIALSIPCVGALAWVLRVPTVRGWLQRLTGWDPGAAPEDAATQRMLHLVDQMQEELDRCRSLLSQYGIDLDQLRQARLLLMGHMLELREAAIAARTQVHALERRFGVTETPFDPLPTEVAMRS